MWTRLRALHALCVRFPYAFRTLFVRFLPAQGWVRRAHRAGSHHPTPPTQCLGSILPSSHTLSTFFLPLFSLWILSSDFLPRFHTLCVYTLSYAFHTLFVRFCSARFLYAFLYAFCDHTLSVRFWYAFFWLCTLSHTSHTISIYHSPASSRRAQPTFHDGGLFLRSWSPRVYDISRTFPVMDNSQPAL